MNLLADAHQRLGFVAAYAERMLRESSSVGRDPVVERERVGSDLRAILETGGTDIRVEQRAMLELAFWSRTYSDALGDVLADIVLCELANLYLDQGKSQSEFVAALQRGYATVAIARDAVGDAAPPAR